MANEENKGGFKVTDRRASAQAQEPKEKVEGPGWEMREQKERELGALPPITFSTFCLSLASSAMIHLGLRPSPETGEVERALPLAKQTIDILAMLDEKTRNNLTEDESKLLAALLYDLRLRYVESKGK